jgi:hypothetical protein
MVVYVFGRWVLQLAHAVDRGKRGRGWSLFLILFCCVAAAVDMGYRRGGYQGSDGGTSHSAEVVLRSSLLGALAAGRCAPVTDALLHRGRCAAFPFSMCALFFLRSWWIGWLFQCPLMVDVVLFEWWI